jgi:hypothetical protein
MALRAQLLGDGAPVARTPTRVGEFQVA